MRVDHTCAELDELGLHCVVHTCGIALVVRTCTLKCTLLVEVVERHIICALCTTAAKGYVVVLADTRLEHFLKPVGIGIVLEVVATILAHLVAAWECGARVGASLTDIVAILLGVHNVVCTARYNVGTKVARVVHL